MSFEDFYRAVYHRDPFPWQRRLAEAVLAAGWGGKVLALPTGVGKTSALDVALYCLASAPERMPRRTVLVVDRRIVVDQAADHARELQRRLADAEAGPARTIADALRELGGNAADAPPFRVAVMRGGMPRDNDWARWPHQPLLGMSTVDQLGSRLLFRGYGVHRMSAPIHAGLIGNDTLVLLDEVHLAVPFAETLDAITNRFQGVRATAAIHELPRRFHVVPMSATLHRRHAAAAPPFALDADDRTHPVLKPRLEAHKLAGLVTVKMSGDDEAKKRETIARRAVEEALALQRTGARVVGIVVNRVDTARLAYAQLVGTHAQETDACLITGRMRPLDRDHLVGETLIPRTTHDRDRSGCAPFVVVSTQCIEAGADLDLDGIVSECASLDALRQRFGRVDRRGSLARSRSVILGRSDIDDQDPVYGAALARTWEWLGKHAVDGTVDFGIDWLPVADDPDLLPNPRGAPVLLPAHVDAWAQTSIAITPDPDVALWLHGPAKPVADVQVVWRVFPALEQDDDITECELEAVRPSTLEAITIPLHAVRRWLLCEEPAAIADVVAGDDVDDDGTARRPRERRERVAWRWRGEEVERIGAHEIRPGDVLVVDVRTGGIRDGSFDPAVSVAVDDLGDLAQLRGRGIATLRLDPDTLQIWGVGPDQLTSLTPEPHEAEREFRDRIQAWIAGWIDTPAGRTNPVVTRHDRDQLRDAFAERTRLIKVGRMYVATGAPRAASNNEDLEAYEAITESLDSSFQSHEVTLRRHSDDVRTFVGEFADRLGLSAKLRADLECAAWFHDVGKADLRFQAWLVGGDELRASVMPEPLAKSSLDPGNAQHRREARARARYPDGYRHELLSLAMIASSEHVLEQAADPELVKHLVASHHGWCRPFAAPIDDPADIAVALVHGEVSLATTSRHQLARLDSGVVDRYWRLTEQYGWWGLAWLEAILRLADHRASEHAESTRRRSCSSMS